MSDGNPIHAFLDEIDLPFRRPAGELAAARVRAGVAPLWPEDVHVATRPDAIPGLLRPLAFRWPACGDPIVAPGRFYGYASSGGDAVGNLEAMRRRLTPALGPPTSVVLPGTRIDTWRAGRASVRADCHPPSERTTDGPNVLYERDPRVRTACGLSIEPGVCPAITSRERRWLDSSRALVSSPAGVREMVGPPPRYERDPAAAGLSATAGVISVSGDGAGLIARGERLLVVALTEVTGLLLVRLHPARGSGGATLRAEIRHPLPGCPGLSAWLVAHPQTDGLTAFAAELADALARPLRIEDGLDD